MRQEVNVLTLLKGSERFVYIFDEESCDQLVNVLRDHAANPQLTINWFDVAVLIEKIHNQHMPHAIKATNDLPQAS